MPARSGPIVGFDRKASKEMNMWSLRAIFVFAAGLLAFLASPAVAQDWPQILGPHRNGHAEGEQLSESWPRSGPKVLWRYALGSGYAGAAVVGDRVVVFHRVGSNERVECLAAATGKSQWKADFPASYRGGVNPDLGPRCVPLIANGSVYAYGAAGDLHAVELATGKKLWSRSLYDDYRGDEGYFGAGSTPMLIGGKLLVNVGGRGAGLVALDPASGKTIWQASDEAASYSAPAAVDVEGQKKAVFVTRLNCVLADPATGNVKTLFPFGQRGPTVNAATPLVFGGKLFVTASYGFGAELASLDGTSATKIWSNDNTMSSQYATPVEHNGFLYGIHGREDVGVAELRCIEAASGKIRWSQAGYGVAHLILAGDKLLIQKTDVTQKSESQIALAAADTAKYRELAAAHITDGPTRALPALSRGRFYVRSGSGGGELICLEVGK
jgi:outer membrane protein assembly factor BamB